MLHLALNVLRHPISPQSGTELARRLALQDLYRVVTDHGVIQVGQHPGLVWVRMLQHGIQPTDLVAGLAGIVLGHHRLQHMTPVQR